MPQTGNPIAGHWWIQSMHPYRVQQASSSIRRRTGGFNPRIHTGCDNKESNYIYTRMTFQSTHPYRVRHTSPNRHLTYCLCFNPRTHTGCDPQWWLVLKWMLCFNPRTHTGCDEEKGVITYIVPVSIHAPIQGATYLFGRHNTN